MRLIDSGSGIGPWLRRCVKSCPRQYVLARIATPVGPSAESGTVGQPEMSTECGHDNRAAQPGTVNLGLASVWIEETRQTKQVCAVAISPVQVPELCRNKNMPDIRWQTQRHLSLCAASKWSLGGCCYLYCVLDTQAGLLLVSVPMH